MRSNAFNFLSAVELLRHSNAPAFESHPTLVSRQHDEWRVTRERKKCSGTKKQETFLSEMKNRLGTWSHLRTSIWIYLHTFSWHYGHSWWTGGERTGGACSCLVTRHSGPELIKTVWFETLQCSAVKVSCKNTEHSQPISLRLLAQERRACLTGTLACQQSPHTSLASPPRDGFLSPRPSPSPALVNGDECKDWAVANNRSKEIVVV